MSLSLFTLTLLNSMSLPQPDPFFPGKPRECLLLSREICTNTYYCGWCNMGQNISDDDDFYIDNDISNNTNITGRCIDVGYCGIGTVFGESCDSVYLSNSCFLIKVCLLSFFLIICINLVYCIIRGIQAPLIKSNFSLTCKKFTVALLYCLIFIPLMTFYFINFTVFIYILCCSAVLGIMFWFCYGSSIVVKIINNGNTEESRRLLDNSVN